MLFDDRPKSSKKDMYDTEKELKSLHSALKKGAPLVTIVGLRRTGKTSLLLTGLNEGAQPFIVLDMRALAGKPYATKKDLILETERALNDFYKMHMSFGSKLFNWLRRVNGVGISKDGLEISWGGKKRAELTALFEELNSWARQEKKRIIVAFDEAQELKKLSDFDMAKLIAHIYDYCKNMTIVLTGSAVGLLYDFIVVTDPKAPLYGRHVIEIRLHRFTEEMARDYLVKGFKEARIKINVDVLNAALRRLDGIVGWLTLFGAICVKNVKMSEDSVGQTVEVGKSLVREEFKNFLKSREVARTRYEAIIRHLARNPSSSWTAVKGALEVAEGRKINPSTANELLGNLVKAGFVEKIGLSYGLSDQMLVESFR